MTVPGHNSNLTYYEAYRPAPPPGPPLVGAVHADVAIVGAGLAGLSAAFQLAQGGYRVRVLEAGAIGDGASGRNGGQVLPGTASPQRQLIQLIGPADARRVWDFTLQGVQLLRQRITKLGIDCDWQPGHLHVADKPRQVSELAEWHRELQQDYRYGSTHLVGPEELSELLASTRYIYALYDAAAGHIDPLAFTRGLARASTQAGAIIHEYSRALSYAVNGASSVNVHTSQGIVRCEHLLLAGNALLGNFSRPLARKLLGIGTYMLATEQLDEACAASLIRNAAAVSDMNWVLDYFRLSPDRRLLFGGRVSYGGLKPAAGAQQLRQRMLRVFPQLGATRIDYSWGGWLDITLNRAPHFGRLAPNIWFLQGFAGHGLALTGIAGTLAAEAIAGSSERFDVFARIPQRDFPGGRWLRQPALALAMLWYRMRDLL
jgi:gamma-glutamylputrescine oxidase